LSILHVFLNRYSVIFVQLVGVFVSKKINQVLVLDILSLIVEERYLSIF